jgi:hypothetical protein
MQRLAFALAALIVCASPLCAAAPPRVAESWEPTRTYGVIVGVLEWEKGALSPFSKQKRKDQELYDLLVKRGVAKDNLVLLMDKQATHKAIGDAVRQVARKAPRGSTFLFYFAGHGGRLGTGCTTICNYDLAGKDFAKDAFAVDDLAVILKKEFQGSRVMFFADCCNSGGLAGPAKTLADAGFKALALTSVDAECISGGTWIYSMTLLDALAGEPLLDADGDGHVSLGELEREIADNMKCRARQHYGYYASGFDPSFRFGAVRKEARLRVPGPFKLGQFVLVRDEQNRRVGRIVGHEKNAYRVQVHDYAERPVLSVAKDNLAELTFERHKVGSKIHVVHGNAIYPAKVLKAEGDFHRIRYDSYDDKWDEWVLSDRIVAAPDLKAKRIEVLWQGQWYPALILKRDGKKSFIRYLGYDSSWDEWVGPERVRVVHGGAGRSIVFVRTGEAWFPAEILTTADKKVQVRYHGCSDESNEWVPLDRVRRVDEKTERAAMVEQKGAWRAAVVLKTNGQKFTIRYVGDKDEAETVSAERVKLLVLK